MIITGLVHDTAAEEAETGGINVNVWSGIGMVAVALAFLLRVVLRPVVPPKTEPAVAEEDSPDGA